MFQVSHEGDNVKKQLDNDKSSPLTLIFLTTCVEKFRCF